MTIDIDAIKARIPKYGGGDMRALIAEVERLRTNAGKPPAKSDSYDNLARCMGCSPDEIPRLIQQHAPWNGRGVCDDVAQERAAVVAWLRDCETHCREHDGRENAVSATYRIAANVIERGEHRKETP